MMALRIMKLAASKGVGEMMSVVILEVFKTREHQYVVHMSVGDHY
jgi:hypothetical protein